MIETFILLGVWANVYIQYKWWKETYKFYPYHPKMNDDYWCIMSDGTPGCFEFTYAGIDLENEAKGNCYRTREELERQRGK